MVNVRLQGLPEEVEQLVHALRKGSVKVVKCSPPYQNRDDKRVRVYADIVPKE